MSLRHILTCLVITSVLATVAQAKPANQANDGQAERQIWHPYSALEQRHSSLVQPYTPIRTFKLFQPLPSWSAQSPDVYYINSQAAGYPHYPFLQPVPQIPNDIPTTTTRRPRTIFKDTEPTTERGSIFIDATPSKFQTEEQQNVYNLDNDVNLLAAVRNINNNYVIEDIETIPAIGPLPAKLPATKKSTKPGVNRGGQIEGPFEAYFLPYLSVEGRENGQKPASIILEPHARAVVGNGGTAISVPISRAVLKRGVPTNVYFNPESVAIAGVGGKAHAQADLELDLINRRR